MVARRTLVRTTTVATLIAAVTDAGGNVFDARTRPPTEDLLPCIIVHTPTGIHTKTSTGGGPSFDRTDQLEIVAFVKGQLDPLPPTGDDRDAEIAADIDRIEQQILDALLCNSPWLALFQSVESIRITQGEGKDGRGTEGKRRRAATWIILDLKWRAVFDVVSTDKLDEVGLSVDMISPGDNSPDGVIDIAADPIPIEQDP